MRNCFKNPYSCVKFFILFSAILYLLSVVFSVFLKLDQIDLSDEGFNGKSKCPLCYGNSLCNDIEKFKYLKLESSMIGDDTYFFNKLVNIKNVFFGRYKFAQKVVIKKLAHDDELDEFDENEKKCLKSDKLKCISKFAHTKYLFVTPYTLGPHGLDIEFGSCMSDRLVDMIYKNYKEYVSTDRRMAEMNLLTTLKINPEPIVLQLFPEKDGWPFPKYIGACGRLIVEAEKGPTILNFIDKPFKLRAKIALSLLESLQLLYENRLNVSLYLMDLGYENISYDEDAGRVYFIDAENSLIVDKEKIITDNPKDWAQTYSISGFDDCGRYGTCLSYDVHSLCDNYHADLNFYSACRNILSSYASDPLADKNFLHSIPSELDEKFNLNRLLNECAKNTHRDGTLGRFSVIKKLMTVLREISK